MQGIDRLKPVFFKPAWFGHPAVKRLAGALTCGEIRFLFFGGAVRDAILGETALCDIDIVASAPPQTIKACLDAHAIPATVGEYGKVVADVDGFLFDLVPWMDENLESADETVMRHAIRNKAIYSDFTINSLFLSPQGDLYDFFGGMEDLFAGRIRFNVDPHDSITVKPSEILRYCRFQAWYGKSEMDRYTVAACATLAHLLPDTIRAGADRFYIHREMARLLAAPNPYPVLATMHEHGILKHGCGFNVQTLTPLAALTSLEQLHGGASDYTIRLAALMMGSNLPPLEALDMAQHYMSLSNRATLKIRTIFGLLDYVHSPLPLVVRCLLKEALGEEGFRLLMMLASVRAGSVAEAHRMLAELTQKTETHAPIEDYLPAYILHSVNLHRPAHMAAFTLLEMSIVLMIIGIFASTILVGRTLIHNSELRSIVTQMELYNTAVQAFRLRYNCMPGDCKDAEDLGLLDPGHTAVGDGNGIIGMNADISNPFEAGDFWESLKNAALIKDTISSVLHGTGSRAFPGKAPELRMRAVSPSTAQQASIGMFPGYYLTTGPEPKPPGASGRHYFWITASLVAALPGAAALLPEDAAALDTKLDDGLPLTGTVQATGDYVSSNFGPTLNNSPTQSFMGASGGPYCVDNTSRYNLSATAGSPDCAGGTCSRCGLILKASF